MSKIIIVIEGGVLQDVIGLPEGCEYQLIDHDIHEGEPGYLTEDAIDKIVQVANFNSFMESHNLYLTDTGGGCTGYQSDPNLQNHILLTKKYDSLTAPHSLDEPVQVGLYQNFDLQGKLHEFDNVKLAVQWTDFIMDFLSSDPKRKIPAMALVCEMYFSKPYKIG